MLRSLTGTMLAVMLLAVLISGCASRQQRVAGTQETASAVTATIDDTGLRVTPATLPPGAMALKVMNNTATPQVLTITGPGVTMKTDAVLPGKSVTLTMPNVKTGLYRLAVQGMDTEPSMAKTLTVGKPPAMSTTATPGKVIVTLTSKGLALRQPTVPTGAVMFQMTNSGASAHTFTITGPGVKKTIGPVAPHSTATTTLPNVKAGKYQITVQDMQRKPNMTKTLTVTTATVAGSQEQLTAPAATIAISDADITVTPATVALTNASRIDVKNTSATPVMLGTEGKGGMTIAPNQTLSFTVQKSGSAITFAPTLKPAAHAGTKRTSGTE